MKKIIKIFIFSDDPVLGQRLDKVLPVFFQNDMPELSRARLQILIEQGYLTHNDVIITSPKAPLHEGEYALTVPPLVESHLVPEPMHIDIIFEDDDILVLNKPAGLTVHPGAGQAQGTLVNGLMHLYGEKLSGIGGVKRPGIVHRLDKDTSGLLVVAKNDLAHQKLSAQFKDHTLSRTYLALVFGIPTPSKGTIDTIISRHPLHRQKMTVLRAESVHGKHAVTHYKVLEKFMCVEHEKDTYKKKIRTKPSSKNTPLSLMECQLETGRTHQIRVHMQHIGCPLVGDPAYGVKNIPSFWKDVVQNFSRQALHAQKLRLLHPKTGEEMTFSCPLPSDMENLLQAIREQCALTT